MSPTKKTIKPPKHLSAPTRRWFEDVVKTYVLEPHHLRLLTLAGEAWDRGQQARETLKTTGTVFIDRFGCPRARPEVAIERDSRLAFARLVRELALDLDGPPESRPPRAGGQRY
ncbi:MAG: hypothetical protein ABSG67_22095 [Thermoguttaceae bacterium]|jgi:phage terminase small subunit